MMPAPDILDALRTGRVKLPPLDIKLAGIEPEEDARRPDAYVDVRWGDSHFRFVVEIKSRATPKVVREAARQVREYARRREMSPLVLTEYLAPERLLELEAEEVSGIDLCGNGIVIIPGRVFVSRTGNPNRFPADRKIKNVYRGVSSLVARTFLARPRYPSVQSVQDEILARGGQISLGTVSKVLDVLDEDLMIRRDGRDSELLRAEELLMRLEAEYRPPVVRRAKEYRWTSSADLDLDLDRCSAQAWNRCH